MTHTTCGAPDAALCAPPPRPDDLRAAADLLVQSPPPPVPIERLESAMPTLSVSVAVSSDKNTRTEDETDGESARPGASNLLAPAAIAPPGQPSALALASPRGARAIRVRDDWPLVPGVCNVSELMRRHSFASAMKSVAESIDSLDSLCGSGTGASSPCGAASRSSLSSPFARDDVRRFSFDVVRARQLDRLEQQQQQQRLRWTQQQRQQRLDDADAGAAASCGATLDAPSLSHVWPAQSSRQRTSSAAGAPQLPSGGSHSSSSHSASNSYTSHL